MTAVEDRHTALEARGWIFDAGCECGTRWRYMSGKLLNVSRFIEGVLTRFQN